jgi:hypothetical protein
MPPALNSSAERVLPLLQAGQGAPAAAWRASYLRGLAWAFAFFSTLRILAYMPTLLAIHASGDSSQHSLWTWGTWLGANLTMALWLYEQAGQRANRAVAVSLCNTVMCAAAVMLIGWYRW